MDLFSSFESYLPCYSMCYLIRIWSLNYCWQITDLIISEISLSIFHCRQSHIILPTQMTCDNSMGHHSNMISYLTLQLPTYLILFLHSYANMAIRLKLPTTETISKTNLLMSDSPRPHATKLTTSYHSEIYHRNTKIPSLGKILGYIKGV